MRSAHHRPCDHSPCADPPCDQNLLMKAQIETSPNGVLVVDQDGNIVSWNPRFLDIWGLSEDFMQRSKDRDAVEMVKPLLVDPEGFEKRILYFYGHLDEPEDGWEIPLNDGRVIERHSRGLKDDARTYWARVWYYRDVTHRVRLEQQLRKHRDHLEDLVAARTARLEAEVDRRRHTQQRLLAKEEDLRSQTTRLAETNTALRVFLKQNAEDTRALAAGLRSNLDAAVVPHLERLAASGLNPEQKLLLEIIRDNLEELAEPFAQRLSQAFPGLTPREVQVADLVRGGRSNKEIASVLQITPRAVEFHRENLRRKLDLTGRKANLRSRLLSIC
jgi:PAS domain S-box-containing protein